jgi:hypothetical protein
METTNPAQGRLRGRTDAALVTTGRDRFYTLAVSQHRLAVPYPQTGWPLDVRVARHLAGVRELTNGLADSVGKRLVMDNVPGYSEVVANGLGAYLNAPAPS